MKQPILNNAPSWQEIIIAGNYKGYQQDNGTVVSADLRLNHCIEMIRNFHDDRQSSPVPVYYSHDHPDDYPIIGYILDLKLVWSRQRKRYCIWALVEFNSEIEKDIKAKTIGPYFSIEYVEESYHQVTGEPCGYFLTGLAFTPTPFIAGMKEVKLNRDCIFFSSATNKQKFVGMDSRFKPDSIFIGKAKRKRNGLSMAENAELENEDGQENGPDPLKDALNGVLGLEGELALSVDELLALISDKKDELLSVLRPEGDMIEMEGHKEDEEKMAKSLSLLTKTLTELNSKFDAQTKEINQLKLSMKLGGKIGGNTRVQTKSENDFKSALSKSLKSKLFIKGVR